MSHNPSTNEERCGNCGTVNPLGQDTCIQCGQPLTASAETGLRTNLDAQGDAAVMGGRDDMTTMGTGSPGDEPRDPGFPAIPIRPA